MKIITLCGSTKFKKEFERVNEQLTMQGNIVISLGFFGHSNNIKLRSKDKEMLDTIHKRKIDLSNEIFIINKNGYIGKSTRSEIEYALSKNIKVNYMEVIE